MCNNKNKNSGGDHVVFATLLFFSFSNTYDNVFFSTDGMSSEEDSASDPGVAEVYGSIS